MSVSTLLLASACLAVGPAELRRDFRAGAPDPGEFAVLGADRGCRVEAGPGGLRLAIPTGGGEGPVGLALRPRLAGDFEVTIAYVIEQVGPPEGGYGAGLGLRVEADTPTSEALTVERQVDPKAGARLVSTHITTDASGGRRYQPMMAPARSASGRLRLSRTGSEATSWSAEGDGPFRAIRAVALGPDEVAKVELTAFTGGDDCAVDVVVTGLDVRAESFSWPGATPLPEPRRGHLGRRLAVAGVINAFLIVAVAAWRWPGVLARNRAPSRPSPRPPGVGRRP